MKMELKDLMSKIVNVVLTSALSNNGGDIITSQYAGMIAEGAVSSLYPSKKSDLNKLVFNILSHAAYESLIKENSLEISEEAASDVIDYVFDEGRIKAFLENPKDDLILNSFEEAFSLFDVPFKEQKINIKYIVNSILDEIDKEIINNQELMLVSMYYSVKFANNQLQIINNYINSNTKIANKSCKNEFISKWDNNLFLHRKLEDSIKLSELYMKPNFIYNYSKQSKNIDQVFRIFLENNDRLMLVLGNAGTGKSSLMCYLANRYSMIDNFCFIKMSELDPVKAHDSLMDSITHYLDCHRKDLKNCVLFLDGYDELRVDNQHYDLCLKLLAEVNGISNLKVVISSRLNYIDLNKNKFKEDFENTLTIILRPFNKQQIKTYVKKYYGLQNKDPQAMINAFENKHTDIEIFGIPLIIYMICALNIDISELNSSFSVYERVFSFNNGLYDKIYDDTGHTLTSNPAIKQELLDISELFAYTLFKNNTLKLNLKDFSKHVLTNYEDRLLDYTIGNYYDIDDSDIAFVHKSFQEYFLCRYIVKRLASSITEIPDPNNLSDTFRELFFCTNYIQKKYEANLKFLIEKNAILNNSNTFAFLKKNGIKMICLIFEDINYSCSSITSLYKCYQSLISSVFRILYILVKENWDQNVIENNCIPLLLRCRGYVYLNLNGLSFKSVDISGAYMRGDISDCTFINSNISRIDLRDALAKRIALRDVSANLIYAEACDFSESCFEEVRFNLSEISSAAFINCRFMRVDFYASELIETSFYNAHLDGVNFASANMKNSLFVNSTVRNCVFKTANMVSANFSGSEIEDADFTGAHLDDAQFVNLKNISGIKLSGASLRNAVFSISQKLSVKDFLSKQQIDEIQWI